MKDLDFDELDRAVNSLITNTPGQDSSPVAETVAPVVPTVSDTSQSSTPTLSLAGRRSTGRFMDVVHPSSDMRNTAAPERISRQGMTINPMTTSETPTVANANMSAQMPVTTLPTLPVVPPEKHTWPDPISFQESKSSQVTPKEEPPKDEDADIDQINDDITNTLNQTNTDSPDSPFISGTKVEKRPLGTFSTELPEQKPATPAPVLDKPVATGIGLQSDSINTPFPAELQDELLSIEADSTTHPELLDIDKTANLAIAASPVTTTPVAPATDSQPAAPVSIAQQYKEQPSTGDQNTGAIYDTDSYHKTPLTPTKKKSGWMWVLWIVILLILGAGAGAAVYFYVLPH